MSTKKEDNSVEHWQKIWIDQLRNGEIEYIVAAKEKGEKKASHCSMFLKEKNWKGQNLRHDVRTEWIEPLLAVCCPSKENSINLVYDESKDDKKTEIIEDDDDVL